MPVNRLVRLAPAAIAAALALGVTGATGVTADGSATADRRGSCQTQQGAVRGFLPRIVAA